MSGEAQPKLHPEQRNLPGTKRDDMFAWQVGALESLEGAFAVQEYLQYLIRNDSSALNDIVVPPPDQDKAAWVYEHLRQIVLELNSLIVAISEECNDQTCPKMVASKWEFLCAAHAQPEDCSAIDYIIHTLDGSAALLNSKKTFPSRVRIPPKSKQHFKSIPRRLFRIFAHVFYHHRSSFDRFESQTFLCSRFIMLVKLFKLMQDQHIIIPEEELHIHRKE